MTQSMESLSNSLLFNTGGWLTTIFAFTGIKTTRLMEFYPLLSFIIAVLSIVFLILRLYLTHLEIKVKKKRIKK